jgi:hypothetical protein
MGILQISVLGPAMKPLMVGAGQHGHALAQIAEPGKVT